MKIQSLFIDWFVTERNAYWIGLIRLRKQKENEPDLSIDTALLTFDK